MAHFTLAKPNKAKPKQINGQIAVEFFQFWLSCRVIFYDCKCVSHRLSSIIPIYMYVCIEGHCHQFIFVFHSIALSNKVSTWVGLNTMWHGTLSASYWTSEGRLGMRLLTIVGLQGCRWQHDWRIDFFSSHYLFILAHLTHRTPRCPCIYRSLKIGWLFVCVIVEMIAVVLLLQLNQWTIMWVNERMNKRMKHEENIEHTYTPTHTPSHKYCINWTIRIHLW